jgi:transposase
LRKAESLSREEQSKLAYVFAHYPELAIAWNLKESLREWYKNSTRDYFGHRITNGFVEGKNNGIKFIKGMAYGYRNIANLRRRVLPANNEVTAGTEASGGFHAY